MIQPCGQHQVGHSSAEVSDVKVESSEIVADGGVWEDRNKRAPSEEGPEGEDLEVVHC